MATLQDVIDCIAALDAAITAKTAATTVWTDSAAAADLDVTVEYAALTPVLDAYNTALNTARANHGYPAAFAAYEAAVSGADAALYTMRDTMKEYTDSIP